MIEILNYSQTPLSDIGRAATICTNSKVCYKKVALDCISANHGRALEFTDITLKLSGYSSRVCRELGRHIIGTSYLQQSTRYVNMKSFAYYIPLSIRKNEEALDLYRAHMIKTSTLYDKLLELNIPKEDVANILPMAYNTEIILKINLRALFHLFELRTCNRALREFRDLMTELKYELSRLSPEWNLITTLLKTKCEVYGKCTETKSCGKLNDKII